MPTLICLLHLCIRMFLLCNMNHCNDSSPCWDLDWTIKSYLILSHLILYYEFSLLHIFSLVLQPWMSAYIRKTDGVYIFSPQKRLKHGRQNITLHWINGIIRNNKCIFTKLNAVFILKTAAWTNNITTVNSVTNTWSIQQTPMFHGCTITNKQNFEPWTLSTSWGHTKVLFTCC
jgi:hypothetical protein